MGTTSNRSWPYPESTDYVADGATAIENLADAIDSSIGTGYSYVQTVYFTSSGTFTKASYPWLRAIRVKAQAGGGGGGGSGENDGSGAGGGGGAYGEKWILASSLGASETVTVGAAGTAGASGNNAGGDGGDSNFGSHLNCGGGQGGEAANGVFDSSTGGTVTNGDLNIRGGNGVPRALSSTDQQSGGGNSILGNAGTGRSIAGSNIDGTDNPPTGYGSGGTGGKRNAINRAGSAGQPGIIIVELYA